MQQQHIYNQYQKQQQNNYTINHNNLSSHNPNNLINITPSLQNQTAGIQHSVGNTTGINNNSGSSIHNINNYNRTYNNNTNNNTAKSTHQNHKTTQKEKEQVSQNHKQGNASGQSTIIPSEIEKKLLHYIPSLIHDLRNPLYQLSMCIEAHRVELNKLQYEILSHSVTHMNELISKALSVFKKIMERKNDDQICDVEFKNIDISKYLEEFWMDNLDIAEQKQNVDYQILVQSTLPHYVNIPKLEVTQVIQNLFSNATKFTDQGSIKLIVSFLEISEGDETHHNQITQQPQEHDQFIKGLHLPNQVRKSKGDFDMEDSCSSQYQRNEIPSKFAYDGGKESSPVEQDISIAIENSQQLGCLKESQHHYPQVRQTAFSVGNGAQGTTSGNAHSQFQYNSATTIPSTGDKENKSRKLQKKLESITYQFDKLKYTQKQDSDYQLNTEENVDEEYTELESSLPCAHIPPSYSTQHKPVDGYSEYFQNMNGNVNNSSTTNSKALTSSTGQQKKKLQSQYSLSSQTHLNSFNPPQQVNGATPKSSQNNNGGIFDQSYNNHIHSFNQIENSCTSSTSRSCHNSTPPTFQVHTFSDIQNAKNTNFQSQNLMKSQQFSSSQRQTPGDNNSIPFHDYSTQYHTPQLNPKTDFHLSKYYGFNNSDQPHNHHTLTNTRKGQIIHSQSSNNIKQQFGKDAANTNFLTECPSPDALSMHSQFKTGAKGKVDNLNSFSSDMNGDIKHFGINEEAPLRQSMYQQQNLQSQNSSTQIHTLPGSADLEGQKKSMKLSAVIKQQQQIKQNKMMVQSSISNSYYYNCQQKQVSQSSGDLRSLKKHQLIGPIHNPALNSTRMNEISEKPSHHETNQYSEEHSLGQQMNNFCCQNSYQEKIQNDDNKFCQIFSKRKSQIHPSIRDLVFSRNNIRNYQMRRVAQIKGYLKFEILDTGKGMDPSEQKKIFDIYQQANNSIKEYYGGSGIGLYSAKSIAKQLQGDIFCHSQKGVGSAFIFYLPCTATYKTETSSDSKDQIKSQFSNNQYPMLQSLPSKISNEINISNTSSVTKNQQIPNSASLHLRTTNNASSSQGKQNQDKQQQLQIMQIKQGLKSADPFNQKLDQQSNLIIVKQQQAANSSPSSLKEQEIQQLLAKIEEKRKKIKIIYIDDSDFLLQSMEGFLGKLKCVELSIEKSPLSCLQQIRANPYKFDIALIDNEMPELDGKQLAKEIKQINPKMILVCHSGYDITKEFQDELIESGFSYLLSKPCFIEDFVILFSQILKIDTSNLQHIKASLLFYQLQKKY